MLEESEVEHVGTEEFWKAEQAPAATIQKFDFFELSPEERDFFDDHLFVIFV